MSKEIPKNVQDPDREASRIVEPQEPFLANPPIREETLVDDQKRRQEETRQADRLEEAIKHGEMGENETAPLPALPRKIEKEMPLTRKEKFFQGAGQVLRRKIMAYGLGAVTGVLGGQEVQQWTRKGTGYDPVEHQKLLKREKPKAEASPVAPKKELSLQSLTEDVKEWGAEKLKLAKEFAANPEKFIKDTESYKTLLTKYYDLAKVIDDVAFVLPALLLLVGIGRYTDRMLARRETKNQEKEEEEKLRSRLHTLEETANALIDRLEAMERRGAAPSLEDMQEAQNLVREGASALRGIN